MTEYNSYFKKKKSDYGMLSMNVKHCYSEISPHFELSVFTSYEKVGHRLGDIFNIYMNLLIIC